MRRAPALAALTLVAIGCGASPAAQPVTPGGPLVTSPATPAPGGGDVGIAKASAKDGPAGAWVSVPYPARSIARIRALLRNAPNALGMLDAMLIKVQGFDLEQPAYLMSNGKAHVFTLGLGKDLAESLRKSNDTEKCSVLELRGNLRFACGVDGKPPADLARAEPPKPTSSDIHAEANAAIIRQLAEKKGVEDKTTLDTLAGLDGMSFDLVLEGTPELRMGWHVTGEDSSNMVWLNAPVTPPPAGFFQLPVDSEMAVFGHAPSPADQAPIEIFFDAMGDKDPECAANSAAERAELEKLFFTGGSFVGAVGLDRVKAEGAADALNKAPTDKKKIAAARDAMKAWAVFGLEEPSARWSDGLTALQKLDCTKKGKPKHVVTVNKKLSPRLGLPAGAIEIVNARAADKDGTPASRDVMIVAPDKSGAAERTWIAVAHDEATAVAKLKGVLAGPSALGSRPGLATLKGPASAGGFVSAGGLMWLFADDKTDTEIVAEARNLLRARDLPTGGRTPIVLRMASTHDANGKGGETTVRMSLDAAALGDVASLMF